MVESLNFTGVIEPESRSAFEQHLRGMNAEEIKRVMYAYDFARWAHGDQRRASGSNYFQDHVVGTALILIYEAGNTNPNTISTTLLHDVPEDTRLFNRIRAANFEEKMEIADDMLAAFGFPEVVRENVVSLTKPRFEDTQMEEELKEQLERELAIEQIRKASPEAKLVKMADRLHNLRTIGALKQGKAHAMIWETQNMLYSALSGIFKDKRYRKQAGRIFKQMENAICEYRHQQIR